MTAGPEDDDLSFAAKCGAAAFAGLLFLGLAVFILSQLFDRAGRWVGAKLAGE